MVNPSASRTLKRKTLIWAGSASKENGFCEACLSGYHGGELDSPKWPAVTLQSWLKLNHCFAGSESLKSQFIPTKITLCCFKSFKFPNVSCLKPCFPSCFPCFSTCFPCISACVPWWFMFSDVSHMFPTFLHIFSEGFIIQQHPHRRWGSWMPSCRSCWQKRNSCKLNACLVLKGWAACRTKIGT